MTYDKAVLIGNAIVCFVMFLRVILFERKDKHYSRFGSWIAWLFLGYTISIPVYAYLDPKYQSSTQLLIANIFLCISMLYKRGNVMWFFKK